jgi:hypothetical protein
MKLVCPVCQAEFPLEAAMNDVAARQAVVKAFELTELGSLLIRYVTLFKPAKSALSMSRLAKLLDELIPQIKTGQITRNGTLYPAPQAYWAQAIETMLMQREKLSLPLKSHGYLLEIISGYANKAQAQAEKKNEQGRKYGDFKTADQPASVVALATAASDKPREKPKAKAEMPAQTREQLKRFAHKTQQLNDGEKP